MVITTIRPFAHSRDDLQHVLRIDREAWQLPVAMTGPEFVKSIQAHWCLVAERQRQVVGFVIYDLSHDTLTIHTIGVDPQHQRTGVGRAIMRRLRQKIAQQKRHVMLADTRETNLTAQQFFRAMQFRAEPALVQSCFSDGSSGIRFRLDTRNQNPPITPPPAVTLTATATAQAQLVLDRKGNRVWELLNKPRRKGKNK